MITPMQMYWLLKLDDIYEASLTGVVLSGLMLTVSVVITCSALEAGALKIYKLAKICMCVSLISTILSSCIFIFLPTTEQMSTIYIMHAIANNEKVQQVGGEPLDIPNQLLGLTKGYLEDKAKDK